MTNKDFSLTFTKLKYVQCVLLIFKYELQYLILNIVLQPLCLIHLNLF